MRRKRCELGEGEGRGGGKERGVRGKEGGRGGGGGGRREEGEEDMK